MDQCLSVSSNSNWITEKAVHFHKLELTVLRKIEIQTEYLKKKKVKLENLKARNLAAAASSWFLYGDENVVVTYLYALATTCI